MATGNLIQSKKHKGESGFTLVELMIAIAIMAILISGSLLLLAHMVRVSDENRDKTFASMQAQYVGFWISEDVVQSQTITLANTTEPIFVEGFPLTLEWVDTGESYGGNYTEYWVEYNIVQAPAGDTWQLQREQSVYVPGIGNQSMGNVTVGEYLYVGQALDEEIDLPEEIEGNSTRCYKQKYDCSKPEYGCVSSLILEVITAVDGRVAWVKYEIHPRAFSTWYPEEPIPEF